MWCDVMWCDVFFGFGTTSGRCPFFSKFGEARVKSGISPFWRNVLTLIIASETFFMVMLMPQRYSACFKLVSSFKMATTKATWIDHVAGLILMSLHTLASQITYFSLIVRIVRAWYWGCHVVFNNKLLRMLTFIISILAWNKTSLPNTKPVNIRINVCKLSMPLKKLSYPCQYSSRCLADFFCSENGAFVSQFFARYMFCVYYNVFLNIRTFAIR